MTIAGVAHPVLITDGVLEAVLNSDTGALISGSHSTTQTSATQTNPNALGVIVTLVTTVIGTGSITLSIQFFDSASGTWVTLLTGAAVITNTTNVYTVAPSTTPAANVAANAYLPKLWRVVVTANNGNPATYTVGAQLVGA